MLKKVIDYLTSKRRYNQFLKAWRIKNKHNALNPLHEIPIHIVNAGKDSYGDLRIMYWNDQKESLTIGNYVSIASNVTFLLGGNHHTNTLMTFPSCRLGQGGQGSYSKGKIIIEDDVWIGYGSTILSGVTIGQGAVIGAGSVVAKSIPPYAVAIGNPIQIVKYRFTPEIIEQLMKLDYSQFNKYKAKANIHLLNKKIQYISDLDNIQELFTQPQIESNQVKH